VRPLKDGPDLVVGGPCGEVGTGCLGKSSNRIAERKLIRLPPESAWPCYTQLDAVDIYETATLDGSVWDILYCNFYHPRKSRLAPSGYHLTADNNDILFYGTNDFIELFPTVIHLAAAKAFEGKTGHRMSPPEIRWAVENARFVRPERHLQLVSSLRKRIIGRGEPVALTKVLSHLIATQSTDQDQPKVGPVSRTFKVDGVKRSASYVAR
jgi:hypothetical protein